MSSRALALLPGAIGQQQPQIVYGEVSLSQPTPTSFADPLFVIVPDWSTDFYYEVFPGNWAASHGSTLPVAGTHCLLVWDNQGTLTCPLWGSTTSAFAPSGAASGDLTGSYPNPTVQKMQGRPVSTAAPSSGQGLVWTGTSWTPATVLQAAQNLTQPLQVDYGGGTVSFAASGLSNAPVVATAIGRSLASVVASIATLWTTSTLDVMATTAGQPAGSFQVQMTSNVGITGTVGFNWIAIG